MKQQHLMRMAALCLLVMTVWSCQKENSESGLSDDGLSQSRSREGSQACKLTAYEYNFDALGFYQLDEYTYQNGRLHEWYVSYGGFYRMEYDQQGRMSRANYYFDDILVNTIDFVRQKQKVVKEIWRDGATGDLVDEVTNEYDGRGRITKSISVAYDYEVTYTYDNRGNVTSWKFYGGGTLLESGDYTYAQQVRNPILDVEGLDYEFAYANGALFTSPRWYSSEKITVYDANGVPEVIYDMDPQQSIYDIGNGNFPRLVTYTDGLSQEIATNAFTYLGCGQNSSQAHRGRGGPGLNGAIGRAKGVKPMAR